MKIQLSDILIAKTEPQNKQKIWLDISEEVAVFKRYVDGEWESIGDESAAVKKLAEDIAKLNNSLNSKQDTLSAGNGISISNNTVSSTVSYNYDSTTGVLNIETISAPVIHAEPGMFTITAEDGATIYYTINGTTPTTESLIYNSTIALALNGGGTVKAIAVKNGQVSSVATEVVSPGSQGSND